jgi:hypothetical protein
MLSSDRKGPEKGFIKLLIRFGNCIRCSCVFRCYCVLLLFALLISLNSAYNKMPFFLHSCYINKISIVILHDTTVSFIIVNNFMTIIPRLAAYPRTTTTNSLKYLCKQTNIKEVLLHFTNTILPHSRYFCCI